MRVDFRGKPTNRRTGGDRRRPLLDLQRLEGRTVLDAGPYVNFTLPSLETSPQLVAGLSTLKITFDQTVMGANLPSNFRLTSRGVDQAFDTSDDIDYALTAQYSGKTTTLNFAKIPTGTYRITAYDSILNGSMLPLDGDGDGNAGGNWQREFSIVPSLATKFDLVGFPSSVISGVGKSFTIVARDSFGNIATGYRGTVAFSSNDATASLPQNYTFTASDAGQKTFSATLNTVRSNGRITVTDLAAGFFKSQTGISVTPAVKVLSGFRWDGMTSSRQAGVAESFELVAVDQFGVKLTTYNGTVRFASSDPQASVPADYTFNAGDLGDRTFSATFKTAGPQQIMVTDVSTGITSSFATTVTPAAFARFSVTGYQSPTAVGYTHPFQVKAIDAYGNLVPSYLGTVAFTSSDSQAILPANYTFTATDSGVRTFSAVLRTTGNSRSITVTDLPTGKFGRQTGIVVQTSFIRYAATSNTIYVDGDVATLGLIKNTIPTAPLTLVDPQLGIWQLDANVIVINGGTLRLHGTAVGGDVNQLRLKSNNSLAYDAVVEVRADYGTIDIDSTTITSWDYALGGADVEYAQYGRAFIRARSSLGSDGITAFESRMNVVNSHISYLGSFSEEAYGLSWKVVGDPGPNFELYDKVNVYGDIINNTIHNLYYGIYTFGAYGMQIRGNNSSHNVIYGIDPHDDSDFLVIEDNVTNFNGSHGIICSKRCNDLIIRNNVASDNGEHGIMLHRSTDNSVVDNNLVERNGDSGIAIYDSRNNLIRGNVSRYNLHGIRLSMGSSQNQIEYNDFSFNIDRGINFFRGNDPPSEGDDGRPKNNTFFHNMVTNNGGFAMRMRDSDGNVFDSNTFVANGFGNSLQIENGVNNLLRNNLFFGVVVVRVRGNQTFTSVLIVQSQTDIQFDLDIYSTVINL